MELIRIVAHQLKKAKEDMDATIQCAEEMSIISDTQRAFADSIYDIFLTKGAATIKCDFHDDQEEYPYQGWINNYLNSKTDELFLEYTTKSMGRLCHQMKNTTATGGSVIFLHYETLAGEFFATIILHEKISHGIEPNSLNIFATRILDIDEMYMGHYLNVNKWKKKNQENHNYLSFIRGKKEVRDYFYNFVGVTNKVTDSESSKLFNQTLADFYIFKNYNESDIIDTNSKIYEYTKKQIKEKKNISTVYVSCLINPDSPEEYSEFLVEQDYELSCEFFGNTKILKNLQFINFRSSQFSIQMKHSFLDEFVEFDEEENTLLIKNLPPRFVALIKE